MAVSYAVRLAQSVVIGFPSSNPAVTNAFTPAAGEQLLCLVAGTEQLQQNADFTGSWTITDSQGLTWTQIDRVANATVKAGGMTAWVSSPAAATSMTITIDCSFYMFISNEIVVYGLTGTAGAIAGYVENGNAATDGAYTATLTTAPTANDLSVYARYIDSDAACTLSMDTGWTVDASLTGLATGAFAVATRPSATSTTVSVLDTDTGSTTKRKAVDFAFIVRFSSQVSFDGPARTAATGTGDLAAARALDGPSRAATAAQGGLVRGIGWDGPSTGAAAAQGALVRAVNWDGATAGVSSASAGARGTLLVATGSGLRPTTELVAVAWLSGVDGLSPSMVATQLPRNVDAWKASGFVTVRTIGGGPSMYTPLRQPVLAVDAWAVNPTSNKPPWFQANQLMEIIDQGCRSVDAPRWLGLPSGYLQARVTTAYWVTEPQRVYSDQGGAARYTANLQLNWCPAVSN